MIKLCAFVLTAALNIVFTLMTIQFGTQSLIDRVFASKLTI